MSRHPIHWPWTWGIVLLTAGGLLLGLVASYAAPWIGFHLQVARKFGGFNDTQSVNGLGVLAQWFRAQGQQVSRAKLLTTQIEQYDLIIWTHIGEEPPQDPPLERLDAWMARGGRLVFLGHDHDATLEYWRSVYRASPPGQRELARWAYRHELAQVSARGTRRFGAWSMGQPYDSPDAPRRYPLGSANRWWQVEGDERTRFGQPTVSAPESDEDPLTTPMPAKPPQHFVDLNASGSTCVNVRSWLQPQNASAQITAYIEVGDRRVPAQWIDRSSPQFGTPARDLWVISVPFFLTNFGILQPEYASFRDNFLREMAQRRRVLFLETGPGPVLLSSTPEQRVDRPWAWMTQAPFPLFALHAVALAVVFCFSKYPQFGRSKRVNFRPRNDFGQHLQEVGRLLRRAGSTDYARQKLEHYYQVLRRRPRTGQQDADAKQRNSVD